MSSGPLSGIRVVEISHMVMGPSCGLVLADLGADVIKIEPVEGGDKTRRLPGSGAGFFPAFNRNKRSVSVNLKSAEGQRFVSRLVETGDVLTENFKPGGLAAFALDYETLSARQPALIYCSMKGFLAGPYEKRVALDEVVQMMGGLAYMTGPVGRPLRAGTSINDIMGGLFAATAIIAALLERKDTGRGQLIRSALFENNAYLVSQHMMQYAVTGEPAAPMPARRSAWAVYDIFVTADSEQIFVGVVTDAQWRQFCESFDLPHLLADPRFATNPKRVAGREVLIPIVQRVFAGMSLAEALAVCERIGLPFAPIAKPQDLFDDPHLATPGAMIEITLDSGKKSKVPALPIEMDGRRFGLRRDLPRSGEHSVELALELGYDEVEARRLVAEGVIEVAQAPLQTQKAV